MLVKGQFNPIHVLRAFLSNEYAFFCKWDKKLLKVAHYKGTWVLVKEVNDTLETLFVSDNAEVETKNELLLGVTNGLKEQIAKQTDYSLDHNNRLFVAELIVKLIPIWVQKLEEIQEITCEQAGRNSSLDEKGNLVLAPRPNEWKQ